MGVMMEILDEGIKVSHTDGSGGIVTKVVDPDDLATALAKQTRIETGLLPRNTRYYTRSEGTEILVLEVPLHIRDVYYSGNQRFRIPMPPTVHFLIIKNNNASGTSKTLVNSYLYVTRTPVVDNNTQLYRFPFGNVYTAGDVCWGSVRKPTYDNLAMFSAVPELLFSSVYNGDLDGGTFTAFQNPEFSTQVSRGSHLMAYLNNKEEFPYDILIPQVTFGAALRGVLNGR